MHSPAIQEKQPPVMAEVSATCDSDTCMIVDNIADVFACLRSRYALLLTWAVITI